MIFIKVTLISHGEIVEIEKEAFISPEMLEVLTLLLSILEDKKPKGAQQINVILWIEADLSYRREPHTATVRRIIWIITFKKKINPWPRTHLTFTNRSQWYCKLIQCLYIMMLFTCWTKVDKTSISHKVTVQHKILNLLLCCQMEWLLPLYQLHLLHTNYISLCLPSLQKGFTELPNPRIATSFW